jgi:hypothetical protein
LKEFDRLGASKKYQKLKLDQGTSKIAYLDLIYVPKGVDFESLQNSADCRIKSKPLALSFLHKGRALWRCSELKTICSDEK